MHQFTIDEDRLCHEGDRAGDIFERLEGGVNGLLIPSPRIGGALKLLIRVIIPWCSGSPIVGS